MWECAGQCCLPHFFASRMFCANFSSPPFQSQIPFSFFPLVPFIICSFFVSLLGQNLHLSRFFDISYIILLSLSYHYLLLAYHYLTLYYYLTLYLSTANWQTLGTKGYFVLRPLFISMSDSFVIYVQFQFQIIHKKVGRHTNKPNKITWVTISLMLSTSNCLHDFSSLEHLSRF